MRASLLGLCLRLTLYFVRHSARKAIPSPNSSRNADCNSQNCEASRSTTSCTSRCVQVDLCRWSLSRSYPTSTLSIFPVASRRISSSRTISHSTISSSIRRAASLAHCSTLTCTMMCECSRTPALRKTRCVLTLGYHSYHST